MSIENRFCLTAKCENCNNTYHIWIEFEDSFDYKKDARVECPYCHWGMGPIQIKTKKPTRSP